MSQKVITKPLLKKVVTKMGGAPSLAKNLQVATSSVYQWLYTDRLVPEKAALAIQKLAGIKLPPKDIKIRPLTKPFLLPWIKKAGGAQPFAEALGMHVSLVSKLLYTDQKIGPQYAIKLAQFSKGTIKAHHLRPDIFEKN